MNPIRLLLLATACIGLAAPLRAQPPGSGQAAADDGRSAIGPPPVSPDALASRSRANLASYLSDDDYPVEAIRAREEGTVSFRLEVGADGSVTGCSITESSGSATLDATTCALLSSRARFRPARDAAGLPVPDSVSARTRWVLPPPDPLADSLAGALDNLEYPPAALRNNEQGRVTFVLEVSAEGTVTACQVTDSSGSAVLDAWTCAALRRVRLAPWLDESGRPAAHIIAESMDWRLSE
jgi:TonB family protein